MIKLIDLLKESSAIAKLSPEEKDKYQQALDLLQNDTLDEGIKDSLKKLGLTAAVIAALLASPNISQAQKSQLKDITPTEMTSKSDTATGTQVDGKNGKFTSQFAFPKAFLINLNTGKIKNLGLDGNDILQQINKAKVSVQQMAEWNNFVGWMSSKGYSGSSKMDQTKFSENVLEQYRKENPNFWVKDSNDIKKIQDVIKAYRKYVIAVWKLGEDGARKKGFTTAADIELGGIEQDSTNPEEVKQVELRFMPWAK
jgi:hypothetical protein